MRQRVSGSVFLSGGSRRWGRGVISLKEPSGACREDSGTETAGLRLTS